MKDIQDWSEIMKKFEISASLVCANPLLLKEAVEDIEKANIEYIHFDVMDGVFVPRYGMYPEIIAEIKKVTNVPVDVHLMVTDPEPYLDTFINAGSDIIYVHVENNNNLHRTVKLIKDKGAKAGIVFNIATPLTALDYVLDDIDYIMLMGINPGIVGHKIIPIIYQKIADVKKRIEGTDIKIMIDGGVTPDTSAKMISVGADILVCGSSTIFRPQDGTLVEMTEKYRKKVLSDLEE